MMDWTHGTMTAGGWAVMILLTLLFLAVFVLITYWIVRAVVDRPLAPESTRRTTDPRQLLDERLARGDIDDEDYRRRRNLIDQGG